MIKLYQFPCSHFCEKARWALEYKRVAYRPVNLVPGFHLKPMRKLAAKSCLPVLVDEETVVQESSAIITYLDTKFPSPALTPHQPQAARAALDWERYLDEHIGVSLRLWFYHHALPDRDLSRADLTACALLAPWCLPPEGQSIPKPLLETRKRLEGRRFYRWVRSIYDNYRQPALAGATTAS